MKVIITDCDHNSIDIEREILDAAGIPFELKQCKTEQDVMQQCKQADILINQYAPLTAAVLQALPMVRQIVRYGVGIDNIAVDAATRFGIQVCNVPDYGVDEVADQALAFMMALVRKTVLMNTQTKKGDWDYSQAIPITRLCQQVVGIIGLGRIGRNFAQKVRALGCQIIGYDKNPCVFETEALSFVEPVTLPDLLRRSDVISIHCPRENAINLIDAAALSQMKQTAYLINVSRGEIVDEAALDIALEKKQIAGAALDVMKTEPPIDQSLFRHEQLLLSPHMAWYSQQAAMELKRKVAEEAVRYAQAQPCRYPVNTLEHFRQICRKI